MFLVFVFHTITVASMFSRWLTTRYSLVGYKWYLHKLRKLPCPLRRLWPYRLVPWLWLQVRHVEFRSGASGNQGQAIQCIRIWLELSPRKRNVGCSNPSRDTPKSLKQSVTAPPLNARQYVWSSVASPWIWPLYTDVVR